MTKDAVFMYLYTMAKEFIFFFFFKNTILFLHEFYSVNKNLILLNFSVVQILDVKQNKPRFSKLFQIFLSQKLYTMQI